MEKITRIKITNRFVAILIIVCMCFRICLQQDEIIFRDEIYPDEGLNCNVFNGQKGVCIDIHSCVILYSMVSDRTKYEFLKNSQCGWNGTSPLVCCDPNWNCRTPSNEPGYCLPSTSCFDIKPTAKPSANFDVINLQELRCSSTLFHVCCSSPIPKDKNIDNVKCEMSAEPPDPELGCCGREVSQNRIIGGEITAIDEYPWTVFLEYEIKNGIKKICGGSLISGLYVLTAAHCVFNDEPISVRLGDYDIDNPGKDCALIDGGGEDCTDEPITKKISKIITHPDYNRRFQANDIALIKLEESAPYTDFIRPVCLPRSDETKTNETLSLKVAGWGVSDEVHRYSRIKLQVDLPIVSREACFRAFNPKFRLETYIPIGEGQICAGGEKGKDSCKGDSGGPLMLTKDGKTDIVGVSSFGFIPCGLEKKPGVYTKVYHYLGWINSEINSSD